MPITIFMTVHEILFYFCTLNCRERTVYFCASLCIETSNLNEIQRGRKTLHIIGTPVQEMGQQMLVLTKQRRQKQSILTVILAMRALPAQSVDM